MQHISTDVLVVGAGPVGLTLAMDLAWRGVAVTVLELRARGEPPSVKCNHVAARTMEVFRRLGVAEAVRGEAGLPADYPNDVAYRTTTTGAELARIPIPCRRDRRSATGGPDTWWPTPEPPHRINQIFLEPILFGHAEAMPNLRVLNRTRLVDFQQDAQGVTATAEGLDGEPIEVACRYLVGCDGARSTVRRAIGASFQGDAVVQRVQSTYFRAPELLGRMAAGPAWATFSLNPRRSGNLYAIDGRETWLLHNYLRPEETDFEAVDRDACLRTILGVGAEFCYEVLSKEDWVGRRLVADRFRDRRAFICGDAAHIWVPMAGYGMNAGIADAVNLSWMLAAVLQGWAAPALLDAHEAERLPITEQVSRHAMDHAVALARQRGAVPADIEAAGPAGDAVRVAVGRAAYDLNVSQYCCGGLNFGYYYDASPVVAYDGQAAPGYDMARFTPSTVPGCRTPHLWLRDGRSLYDALGPGYTLLRFDPRVGVAAIEQAAASRGVPFLVLDVDAADTAPYDRALVLSRPDGHVAWRGDAAPADPLALVDLIRGAAPAAVSRAA